MKNNNSNRKLCSAAVAFTLLTSGSLRALAIEEVGAKVSEAEIKALYKTDFDTGTDLQPESGGVFYPQSAGSTRFATFAEPENFDHPEFQNPSQTRSDAKTKTLEQELQVGYANRFFKTFQDSREVHKQLYLRSYNGKPTGPTIVASPGDTLKIRLVNNLPPDDHPPVCDSRGNCDINIPHNFNTTNLHTHGLHVSPSGNSDNVLLRIKPGETFDYAIHIPENHPAGTFWYHAHSHGAATIQVGSGMHGALIVRGDYDEIPALEQAPERIMLLQHIAYDEAGTVEDNENYSTGKWRNEAAQHGWHISINGQVMPEMLIPPGVVERWRLIHAGVREFVNLRLINACDSQYDIPLVQIAADGIPFDSKRLAADGGTFLAPGYRSDVLVKPLREGVYYLVDTSVEGAAELPDAYCDNKRGNLPLRLDGKAQNILARVTVAGPGLDRDFPSNAELSRLRRPAPVKDSELIADIEYAQFSIMPKEGGENLEFLINGQSFDPNRSRDLKLNTAQTWYLSSTVADHPFHIHTNPFEVIKRDARGNIVDRFWRDTVRVSAPEEGEDPRAEVVEIRTRYTDFTGSFMMHCHILDHEDRGMMELVRILP